MNINRISGLNPAAGYKKSMPVQAAGRASQKDGVTLSQAGKIFDEALQKVKSFPEVREDKVAELSSRIKNGSYRVNISEVADKIIKNIC